MIWPAFLLGLFGGIHCLGMCGPIVLALPIGKSGSSRFVLGRVVYNFGRITTYSVLGGLVAIVGVGAAFFHLQQYLSIALGMGMIVYALLQIAGKGNLIRATSPFFKSKLISFLSQRLKKGRIFDLFFAGMGNGLLPCGLVYLGLGYAAISSTILEGMSAMALFGLGTFPVMLAVSLSSNWITPAFRSHLNRLLPFLILLLGVILFLRGMGLGIPFLSPEWQSIQQGKPNCCLPK